MPSRLVLAAVLVVLGVGFTAAVRVFPPGTADRDFAVTGVVTAIGRDGTVSVAHDDIAGFMPAMTMPFVPEDPAGIAKLRPGDRVRFTLRVGEQSSRITGIVVTGRSLVVDRSALPAAASRVSARVRPGDHLPAFALIDQEGTPLTADDLRGQRTILTFIFTRCPMPEFCPRIMSRFRDLQRTIAADASLADVRLLGVTLDPEHDRPEVLAAYGRAAGADFSRWSFATGSPEGVDVLTRAFAVHVQRTGVLPDHTLATALIDAEGRVVEIWRGNGWETDEVLATLAAR